MTHPSPSQPPLGDLPALLASGQTVLLPPQGTSMWPTIVGGRDLVELHAPTRPLRAGDVVLYRRRADSPLGRGGVLVLHRVARVEADGALWTRGDNQFVPEGPIAQQEVLGVLVARVRDGRRVNARSLRWRTWGVLWGAALPARKLFRRLRGGVY